MAPPGATNALEPREVPPRMLNHICSDGFKYENGVWEEEESCRGIWRSWCEGGFGDEDGFCDLALLSLSLLDEWIELFSMS